MAEGKGNYIVTYSGTGTAGVIILVPPWILLIKIIFGYYLNMQPLTNEFGVWLSEIRMKPFQGSLWVFTC